MSITQLFRLNENNQNGVTAAAMLSGVVGSCSLGMLALRNSFRSPSTVPGVLLQGITVCVAHDIGVTICEGMDRLASSNGRKPLNIPAVAVGTITGAVTVGAAAGHLLSKGKLRKPRELCTPVGLGVCVAFLSAREAVHWKREGW